MWRGEAMKRMIALSLLLLISGGCMRPLTGRLDETNARLSETNRPWGTSRPSSSREPAGGGPRGPARRDEPPGRRGGPGDPEAPARPECKAVESSGTRPRRPHAGWGEIDLRTRRCDGEEFPQTRRFLDPFQEGREPDPLEGRVSDAHRQELEGWAPPTLPKSDRGSGDGRFPRHGSPTKGPPGRSSGSSSR